MQPVRRFRIAATSSKTAKLILHTHTHTHFLSISASLTHTHTHTHTDTQTWKHTSPQSNVNASFYCIWYTALTCRVCSESTPHGLRSVWPLQASIHICLFLPWAVTESRQNAKKATIYLKVDTPPGWGSNTAPVVSGTTSPLWTQGSCPQPTHRHTPFKLAHV